MGNEVSSQKFVHREEDVSGNVIGQNQNCAMQHLKLADWEKAGVRLFEPAQFQRPQVCRCKLAIFFPNYRI